MPRKFLAQMDTGTLRPIRLARGAKWAPLRGHTNIKALVLLVLGRDSRLLSSWDHVATHIERGMVITWVRAIGFPLIMPLIDHFFRTVDWAWCSLDNRLLDAATVETLVEDLSLMGEVARAWLVCLRWVTRGATLTHFLWLLQPLWQNRFVRN